MVAYTTGIQYVGADIWFCSHYGQILRSRDEGETWDWDYRAPYWKSLSWSDPDNGWVVTGTQIGTDGYVLRTTDAGLNWTIDRDAPGGAQVIFVDSKRGWMLWEGSGASVWRTTDSGQSWDRHFIGGSWIDGICFVSPQQGWAHGSNGTMRTTSDGGVSWAPQTLGTGYYCDAAFFLNENDGWAGGGYGGANGFIRHTSDGGTTWVPQSPATDDHLVSFFFLDDQNGWALGYGGRVQRTTNGGEIWQFAGAVGHFYAYEILMTDEMNGWISVGNPFQQDPGYNGRGYIYRTTDGGTTWDEEWSSPWIMGHIYDLSMQMPTRAWACGHNNALLVRYDPASVADLDLAQLAWSIGPNPFTNDTKIRFTVPVQGQITLAIYDILGREVTTLVRGEQRAGTHEIVWDGRGPGGRILPGGAYFGRLTVNGRSAVRRILLRR
jgi:photosystem II stability/assembly factor-like uncharacterized protein